MGRQDIRKELIGLWEEIKCDDMPEGLLEMAEGIIKKSPECTDVLIERFQKEMEPYSKKLLAQMILYGVHYQPAIDFLKNECGWDDFTGFVGFPEM